VNSVISFHSDEKEKKPSAAPVGIWTKERGARLPTKREKACPFYSGERGRKNQGVSLTSTIGYRPERGGGERRAIIGTTFAFGGGSEAAGDEKENRSLSTRVASEGIPLSQRKRKKGRILEKNVKTGWRWRGREKPPTKAASTGTGL